MMSFLERMRTIFAQQEGKQGKRWKGRERDMKRGKGGESRSKDCCSRTPVMAQPQKEGGELIIGREMKTKLKQKRKERGIIPSSVKRKKNDLNQDWEMERLKGFFRAEQNITFLKGGFLVRRRWDMHFGASFGGGAYRGARIKDMRLGGRGKS